MTCYSSNTYLPLPSLSICNSALKRHINDLMIDTCARLKRHFYLKIVVVSVKRRSDVITTNLRGLNKNIYDYCAIFNNILR